MPSESGDSRPPRVQATTAAYPPPKLAEPLPCPRCHSTNTKFCYYNNYNLAQPRHFCKSCRRYWTQGGTLRDVPIGGGSRKASSASSSKRPRSSSSSSASSSSSSAIPTAATHEPKPMSSLPVEPPGAPSSDPTTQIADNTVLSAGYGSFASLLSGQSDGAFLALGSGNGYGFGYGFEEMGMGYLGGSVGNVPVTSSAGTACDTWQIGDMDGNGGDSFLWPGLEMSMQGNNIK